MGSDGMVFDDADTHLGFLRVEQSAFEDFCAAAQSTGAIKPNTAWPWGKHETELLRHLDAAARRWWVHLDPSDNTTAPTNAAVSEWLQARGVSKVMADKMATMLRSDGLPTGPRT